ncbi:nucleotidyltransferase family protein [Sulfitobacter sp.]|nr:nucleotidyltransferase family protein [Sulfitobacter sp.]
MIPVLILAAGTSSRMRGTDKLLEDVDGIPLLRRSVQRALATGAAVYVCLPAAPHPRYSALENLGLTTVPVADAAQGMSVSLRAGLQALPADTPAVMVLLADMPDLTTEDFNTVLQTIDLNSKLLIWRATTRDGAAGHPIVFRDTLFAPLMGIEGDTGGSDIVKANRDKTVMVRLPDNHARTDLDTPEAWDAWRKSRPLT